MKKIKNVFSNLPKKTIAIIGGVAIVLALGITSTIKSYNEKTHGDYVIASDSVYSKLSGTTDITLTNLTKETDSVARARTDNVITFVVKGKNTKSDMEVNYEVQLDEGETVSGKTRLAASNLKFYLTETIGNTETTVVSGETYTSLNSTGIYTNQIAHGTSDEETRTYKLRVWVSSSSSVTTETLANSYISVHVKIRGSFYQDNAYKTIADLASTNVSYLAQYTGNHKDSYTENGTKDIYYYTGDDSINHNNVIFAGFCWQILRTTDTGGVKMIYNGIADNNQCLNSRSSTNGIISSSVDYITGLPGNVNYGTTFTYDLTNNTFQLSGETFKGTYTVGNSIILRKYSQSQSSQILYYTGKTGTNVTRRTYYRSSVPYFAIGQASYNEQFSPAYVGYMFGDDLTYTNVSYNTGMGMYFGSSVTWDGTNYHLVDATRTTRPTTTMLQTHHFWCFDSYEATECSRVGYVYYADGGGTSLYYFLLENGDLTPTALLDKMLRTNTNNSTVKSFIDAWYVHNLTDYNDYLEDTIFCNDRSIIQLGGWDPSGSVTGESAYLLFNGSILSSDLGCTNITDQFSMSNPNAQLTYPIGLPSTPEMNLINSNTARSVGSNAAYWLSTPNNFDYVNASVRRIYNGGIITTTHLPSNVHYIRPVISLNSSVQFSSVGDGSTTNPYQVREPGTIDSCPGCVFTYSTSVIIVESNGNGATTLTSDQYETDYREVIANSDKNYFLGFILNSSNKTVS